MKMTYLTRKGLKKLKEKMDYLIEVKRIEIADKIAHARSYGDLKENAEYNAAKEEQALNDIRIKELTDKLTSVTIIDDIDIPDDKVYIGATVELKNTESDEQETFILVSESEADIHENKISTTSPIAQGLLGHKKGDVVTIQIPAGKIQYKILKISR